MVGHDCASIAELWVYPIKACRGTRVQEARTIATGGFEFDRTWCVLDARGDRYPEREYISQRKIAKMATIVPRFSEDRATLTIRCITVEEAEQQAQWHAPGTARLGLLLADCYY